MRIPDIGRASWLILRALGLEENQPALYYKDVALSLVFLSASIVAIVFSLTDRLWHPAFWVSIGLAVGSLALASHRLAIVAGILFFAATRFAVAFVMSPNPVAFGVALACGIAGLLIVRSLPERDDSNAS